MNNRGVKAKEQPTSISTPVTVPVGIPFVIGIAPVQSASSPAVPGVPVLCRTWAEAVAAFGYTENWLLYKGISELIYSHFRLYERGPVIIVNLLDPATMNTNVAAADITVENRKVMLPLEAINDNTLVVKPQGGSGSPYVKGTDYDTFYSGENLVIELISGGGAYDDDSLNVAYKKVTPASVDAAAIAAGMESIEQCIGATRMVPDLILAPGFSSDPMVAAVMTAKKRINGLFAAKAILDISTEPGYGARTYQEASVIKQNNNFTDKDQIVCWPMLGNAGRVFHMSTQLAGLMATVDSDNDGVPYESPSNKPYCADSIILADGTAVNLTPQDAEVVESDGIVTALNFFNGLVCFGNYTACKPISTDVKDIFIPISRMFGWVGNTLIRTHWNKLDKPMITRLMESIIDSINIWLNGLAGREYLLGASVVFDESLNPPERLRNGRVRAKILMTPPPPLTEAEFELEYDLSALNALFE